VTEQLGFGRGKAAGDRHRARPCPYFVNADLSGYCSRCGFPRSPHVTEAASRLSRVEPVPSAVEDEDRENPWR
jgi:hypothetical protein